MTKNQLNTKYIFISGGVLSSLGKGITTASLGLLLQSRGYRVTIVKCENYLNIDAGLINPIEHGDAFLCEDGTETDMDIGNYERFLDKNLGKHNFLTMGQIYHTVIERERNFGYGGEDVEAIPHVTDEIISRLKEASNLDQADLCLVELGGTVGEYQNVLYYEASRIMKLLHADTVAHIHISYLPTPTHIGEPKTKPTQLSLKQLNSMGIQPDFLIARSAKPLDVRRKKRLALFSNIDPSHIINNENVDCLYKIPLNLHHQKLDSLILKSLNLPIRPSQLTKWKVLVKKADSPKNKTSTIAIVGKYFKTGDYNLRDSYAALIESLEHSAINCGVDLDLKFINSEEIERDGTAVLNDVTGIVVPIGWGPRGVEGKISAINYARTKKVPFLGLCYGMQLAVVEYARNVLGLEKANTEEVDQDTPHPVIHIIPKQKRNLKKRAYGGTMRLGAWKARIKKNTSVFDIYLKSGLIKNSRNPVVSERHRHRYEVNNNYLSRLEESGLIISGVSQDEGLVEFIELDKDTHPFFIATQAHPEYKSRPLNPHPLILEFIRSSSK